MKKICAIALSILLLFGFAANLPAETTFEMSAEDEKFIDMVERKAFDFFWENADPETGLIKDQTNNFTEDTEKETHKKYRASIASVGFGLSAYIIGVERGWITKEQAYQRIKVTLNTFDKLLYRDNRGLYYHWIDMRSNKQWIWPDKNESEISTIDTALFITGAITAAEYYSAKYKQPEFKEIVDRIFRGIKWNAFGDQLMQYYNEYIIMTLMGMGAPEHTIQASGWDRMWRNFQFSTANRKDEANFPRVFYPALFIHQFPQAWFDFRDKHDKFADYFISSRNSVLANRQYCIDHAIGGIADKKYQFTTYGPNSWGLSASEIPPPRGYDHTGEAEPALEDVPESGMRGIAGNVAIHAAGGSMPFTPEESLAMMKYLYENYKDDLWGKYGFCDAYNTDPREKNQFNNKNKTMWRAEIVSGLDQGIILLMIENYRTGLIWKYFMMNEYVQKGMERTGFVKKEKIPEGASLDLSGKWAFKTGNNMKWKDADFDDSLWNRINVPAKWEDEGFPDFDGIAWYRTVFSSPKDLASARGAVVLRFGAIDDADEVYLNGEKIGGLGKFPPSAKSAWGVARVYEVPRDLMNTSGDNLLAVRVSDTAGGGGIWKGPVDITLLDAIRYNPLRVDISKEWKDLVNLEGSWKFRTGAADIGALPSGGWKDISVPGEWEKHGFAGYDGLAVYKKEFKVERSAEKEIKTDKLVLKIGGVDDADITYLNGKEIGRMGDFPPEKGSAWDVERMYEFPKGLVKFGEKNVIVIKVNDNTMGGGIVRGPVKIIY
ncbi:MAG: glucoamylase family protein [Elusimicrobiota bacterium]